MGNECYRAAFTSIAFRTFGSKRATRRPFLRTFGATGAKRLERARGSRLPTAAPAELLLHRRSDLVPREVVKAVVVRPHTLRQVGASVDRVRLIHRRDAREVLHRRQVAVVARGVDD